MRADALAGLPGAISSVPDGMAAGVLAGVNPVHGLYACVAGPVVGGLGSSTRLMVITTTSAAALAAGSGVAGFEGDERGDALVLLTLLAGAFMAVAGVLRLGRYTRFVSHSVMLGFLSGIAINIILGQLADLTGGHGDGGTAIARAIDLLSRPGELDLASTLVGLGALAILLLLARTPAAIVSTLAALVAPTAVVLIAGLDTVTRVEDGGAIPRGLPIPRLPDFGLLSPTLVAAAAATAAIVLVQGSGVAESAPNADGPSKADQDFLAQGAANVAAAALRGMPVGGSVGQTALNVAAGARTRWASVWAGAWMALILVAFSGVVGKVAMPTLAAILIFAAVGALRPHEVQTVARAGTTPRVAVIATFVATLLLPVPVAVGVGVVISLLLQLNQEAVDLAVVQLVENADGRYVEQPPPARLASHTTTVLDVYGSLFYAGSRTLQTLLPDPSGAERCAVVLRLRGRTTLGATFFAVASQYAERLEAGGGRLYLTGLDPRLADRLRDADGKSSLVGAARLYEATPVLGDSTHAAAADATTWVLAAPEQPRSSADGGDSS